MPWHDILLPKPSWLEKIVRPILVYAALLVAFRMLSKRDLGSSTTFDLLIVLLISNVVQNALIGEDNSILGSLAGAGTLLLLSVLLNRLTARKTRARRLLEGVPVLLVYDGKAREDEMARTAISRADLNAGLRAQGVITLEDVRFAVLELDGSISVIKKDEQKGEPTCLPPEIRESMAH